MDDQHQSFYERELSCEKCVEETSEHSDSDPKQCRVPGFRDVSRIVQIDESLNLEGTGNSVRRD